MYGDNCECGQLNEFSSTDFGQTETSSNQHEENNQQQHLGLSLHWFRRGLRFHDNPALCESLRFADSFRCIYIIDPASIDTSNVDLNNWRFLLDSLQDLDTTLRKHNSRLYVLQGHPSFVLPSLFKDWQVSVLSFEEDPTPFGDQRDTAICRLAEEYGVGVVKKSSHTLFKVPGIIPHNGQDDVNSLKQFAKLFGAAGKPDYPLDCTPFDLLQVITSSAELDSKYSVPTLESLGFSSQKALQTTWKGGEMEALKRLAHHLERRAWVACFDKPKISKESLMASPSCLGPYLNFGCLSPRLLYWKMELLYQQIHRGCDPPPFVHGQLMLREFFYAAVQTHSKYNSLDSPGFCLPIPWDKPNSHKLELIEQGRTGFPWIDAIICQLISEGWIHSFAKQSLIAFITYGQMFYSWEEVKKMFDKYLIEGDSSTNTGITLMLSHSSLSQSIPKITNSPVVSGKAIDPSGDYIRHYIPALKAFPREYIYEPWTASLELQEQADCIIGRDYPEPMVDHYHCFQTNIQRFRRFTYLHKKAQKNGSIVDNNRWSKITAGK